MSQDKGQPLPKFGEWDVNDPASAEGFTVIFNKARDEKKTGGKPESPGKGDSQINPGVDPAKPQAGKKWCEIGLSFLPQPHTLHKLICIVDDSLIFRKNGFAAFKTHLQNPEKVSAST